MVASVTCEGYRDARRGSQPGTAETTTVAELVRGAAGESDGGTNGNGNGAANDRFDPTTESG